MLAYSGGSVSTYQLERGSFHPPLEVYSPAKESCLKKLNIVATRLDLGYYIGVTGFIIPDKNEKSECELQQIIAQQLRICRLRKDERQRSPYLSDR
jgi:hypothetical protein